MEISLEGNLGCSIGVLSTRKVAVVLVVASALDNFLVPPSEKFGDSVPQKAKHSILHGVINNP